MLKFTRRQQSWLPIHIDLKSLYGYSVKSFLVGDLAKSQTRIDMNGVAVAHLGNPEVLGLAVRVLCRVRPLDLFVSDDPYDITRFVVMSDELLYATRQQIETMRQLFVLPRLDTFEIFSDEEQRYSSVVTGTPLLSGIFVTIKGYMNSSQFMSNESWEFESRRLRSKRVITINDINEIGYKSDPLYIDQPL